MLAFRGVETFLQQGKSWDEMHYVPLKYNIFTIFLSKSKRAQGELANSSMKSLSWDSNLQLSCCEVVLNTSSLRFP